MALNDALHIEAALAVTDKNNARFQGSLLFSYTQPELILT